MTTKKPKTQKMSKQINISLTEEQYHEVKEAWKPKAHKECLAEFVRRIVLGAASRMKKGT